MKASDVKARLKRMADPEIAKNLQWFFKTGPGEYGEGDRFIGIKVPNLRKVAKEFKTLSIGETTKLLRSPIHEERLVALFILVQAYTKGDASTKERIYRLYLKSTKYTNNWDLIDLSAPRIVGVHLVDRSRMPLYRLAKSKSLWERRIAMLATSTFIWHNDFSDALKIAEILLNDDHDLIHKAVGWMLREIGKRDLATEERFLKPRYQKMPRTMLRYAIEKFPEAKRQRYLKGRI